MVKTKPRGVVMIFEEKKNFISECDNDLSLIYDDISSSPVINLSSLDIEKTKLCIVDVINGFIKCGPLSDESISQIIPEINLLSKVASEKGMEIISLYDNHDENSPEFESFPPHCLEGTEEASVVDELSWLEAYEKYKCLPKKSTNAFFEDEIKSLTSNDGKTDTFIVVGDCTDICVLQFALALKVNANANGKRVRVIVPVDCVDTYDAPMHNKNLMNLMSLRIMKNSGIEIVRKINTVE